jgi:hypothetical protein
MYRCGKTYQDRPCAAGQSGKAMGRAVGSAAAASGVTDAECVQRGQDSLKVVWAREGGATEERLLGEARSQAERSLIRDVYRRPGAASTVRAAVEADCVAAKAQAEKDEALAIAAAIKARREGKLPPPGAAAYGQPAAADPAEEEKRKAALAQAQAEQAAEAAKRRCERLNDAMESVRADERRGGSTAAMERLAQQRRQIQSELSKAGC